MEKNNVDHMDGKDRKFSPLSFSPQPMLLEFDDILTDISEAETNFVFQNGIAFGGFLKVLTPPSDADIKERKIRNPVRWILSEYGKPIVSKDPLTATAALASAIQRSFFCAGGLLQQLPTSFFARKVIQNRAVMGNSAVSEVYIMIRDSKSIPSLHEAALEKQLYCKKNFDDPKIKICFVEETDGMAEDTIKRFDRAGLIATDDILLVADMVRLPHTKKEFLMPMCGYDIAPEILKRAIAEKGDTLSYF